jgi:hypothetical protein
MEQASQLFLMELLAAIIQLAVPVIAAFVIGLVWQGIQYVREKLGSERTRTLEAIIAIVVKAAEQTGLTGEIAAAGKTKKAWAIQEAQRLLNERGYGAVSMATLSTMIESAIKDGVEQGWPGTTLISAQAAPAHNTNCSGCCYCGGETAPIPATN